MLNRRKDLILLHVKLNILIKVKVHLPVSVKYHKENIQLT